MFILKICLGMTKTYKLVKINIFVKSSILKTKLSIDTSTY